MALPVLWCKVEPVNKRLAWVVGIGLGSLAGYALLARRYPLESSLTKPRGAWTSLAEPTWPNAALHFTIYLGLTLLYLAALQMLTRAPAAGAAPNAGLTAGGRVQILLIFMVWFACSGIAMAVAPAGESHDIFDYLFRGRMMAEYRGNPLADVPKSYSSAPYYHYLAWHSHVDTYGPLWEMTSAGVAVTVREALELFGSSYPARPSCPQSPASCRLLIAYLTGYRLLAVSLVGVSGLLIASMVNRSQPALVPAALVAWLWCPMTIIATALGSHNDSVMLFLLLFGVWLLQHERPFWALLALVLAAHIKLTAFIWLPVFAVWIVRRWGWQRALRIGLVSAALGLGLSWLLYAPFDGWTTLTRMLHERSLYLANSAWLVLNLLFGTQWGWSKEIVRRLTIDLPSYLFVFFAALISIRLLKFRPNRWLKPLLVDGNADHLLWIPLLAVSLLYLLVGSFWFQPWYVLWVVAPAALLPGSPFTRSVLPWLSFGALSANLLADFLPAIAPGFLSPIHLALTTYALIWLPGLIASLICWAAARYSVRVPSRLGNGLHEPVNTA